VETINECLPLKVEFDFVRVSYATLEPIKVFTLHFYFCMQVNKHCVPIQSMYALTMERILAAMWHPSEEEEAQNKVVEKWQQGLISDTPYAIRTTLNNHY